MLAKSTLNRIEALVSQAVIDMEISYEEFNTILKEKNNYEKMKENLGNVSEKLGETNKIMRLSIVNQVDRDRFVWDFTSLSEFLQVLWVFTGLYGLKNQLKK